MRNSVSMVGSVRRIDFDSVRWRPDPSVSRAPSAMERGVDLGGKVAAHALDRGELLDAGRGNAAEPAEMLEQGRAPFRADAGDFLQAAFFARFFAPLAVAGDGETVGFVAHALDQVQREGLGTGPERLAVVAADQGFVAGAALGALGHAD